VWTCWQSDHNSMVVQPKALSLFSLWYPSSLWWLTNRLIK
jgi:hypothetical protein